MGSTHSLNPICSPPVLERCYTISLPCLGVWYFRTHQASSTCRPHSRSTKPPRPRVRLPRVPVDGSVVLFLPLDPVFARCSRRRLWNWLLLLVSLAGFLCRTRSLHSRRGNPNLIFGIQVCPHKSKVAHKNPEFSWSSTKLIQEIWPPACCKWLSPHHFVSSCTITATTDVFVAHL